jgi:hypothetical protein
MKRVSISGKKGSPFLIVRWREGCGRDGGMRREVGSGRLCEAGGRMEL